MSKRPKKVTIYERGSGQLYGDFRPYGGKCAKALIEKGETRATTDLARAEILADEYLKELKSNPKPTRGQEAMLGAFAEYHLKYGGLASQRWTFFCHMRVTWSSWKATCRRNFARNRKRSASEGIERKISWSRFRRSAFVRLRGANDGSAVALAQPSTSTG